jgi:hypothetical protein
MILLLTFAFAKAFSASATEPAS